LYVATNRSKGGIGAVSVPSESGNPVSRQVTRANRSTSTARTPITRQEYLSNAEFLVGN
jgi:hypothetical protein